MRLTVDVRQDNTTTRYPLASVPPSRAWESGARAWQKSCFAGHPSTRRVGLLPGAALSRPGVEFRLAPGAANYSSSAGPLENKVREIPRLVGAEVQMVGDTGLLAGEAEAAPAGGKHGFGIDERRD